MTVSTHVYSAAVIGPDLPLDVKGGMLTLDESQAPHVSASIDVATPLTATLDALDPRAGARVRVTCDGQYPSFSAHRVFDLGLRSRPRRRVEATVTLDLASDEALLMDWAPLADVNLYDYRGSLRAIVNQVLGKVLPGTALEASPALDADCTPYWDAENLIPNPTGGGGTTGWTIWFGGTGDGTLITSVPGGIDDSPGNYVRINETADSNAQTYLQYGNSTADTIPNVNEKTMYTLSAYLYQNSGQAKTGVLNLFFKDENGARISGQHKEFSLPSTGWHWVSVTTFSPTGTRGATCEFGVVDGMPAGAIVGVTGAVLAEGTRNDEWFTGDKADTAHYSYTWQGAPNASLSSRAAVAPRSPESLTWNAGQSAMEFLQPLVQAAGYRLVCDEQRHWTLRGADYQAPGVISIREGVNLIDREDTINRDAGTWFDAQITRYRWTAPNGNQKTKIDAYALNTPYTRLNVVDVDAAYPGAGRSRYAVQRAQGRGHEGRATAVADWRAQAEQPLVITDGDYIQTGTVDQVTFNLDRDEMTVTSRTTDTPLGAIDLIPGTIDALTGTIDNL